MIREIKKEEIAELIQKVDELGRYLTNHPEVSGEEKESCEYITQFLKKEGYEITAPYGEMPYSFRAVDKEKKQFHGKKAVFLCEYDALPEVGHACGHSYSCAISILGALLLKKFYPDLPMRIDLVGTPGEEFVGGKCYMTENGAFDEYEYAAMIHLYNRDSTYFEILASNDRYFTFHGKAAHASAFPEEGVNALNAARLYMEAMDIKQLESFEAGCLFAQVEGIIPAPESCHAIAATIREANKCKETGEEKVILFNLSGHGLIDMASYDKYLAGDLQNYELTDNDIQKNLDEIGNLA